ncbi:hypothetical protein J2T61_001863 [Methanocalculus sp. AMF5]|uniref:hypothetical protein n=1 Tax=Methanocalculus sp. AMF5 TaxID=1198257 RepID=UPI0020A18F16|nr:hypothetical protein [Methanocalculus sp. AMF5]MCP1663161.1 hypothetical protein [Methanocalculus sp. AMF5]
MRLRYLLDHTGKLGLSQQYPDGSLPAGHNGPYHDPETPVRNTAHFLHLFAALYERTGDSAYKVAGEKAISYLMSSKARPFDRTFYCRDKPGKDKCNGLVGQAWVIEALVKAAEVFDRPDCYQLAEDVFLLHPWDEHVGIWSRVDVDGTVLTYDKTFNHQLWFAAAGAMLAQTPIAARRAKCFIEKIASNVQLYSNGVIFHASPMGQLSDYYKTSFWNYSREVFSRFFLNRKYKDLYSKSAGYHGFNLYAFALLYYVFPKEVFWGSNRLKRMMELASDQGFIADVRESVYGYRYNISGIEIAYAVETFFPEKTDEITAWLQRQLKETHRDDAHPLTRGVADEATAIARIYQAARLKGDYEVEIASEYW